MSRTDARIFGAEELCGKKVVVGLSGGADSVTLTHLLKALPGVDLIACHVNHHLRGDESDRDMQFVESLCAEWKIPLFCCHADVQALAKERGDGLEEAGRAARYAFFEEIRVQEQADWIVTAHTASDSMETMLLNLARGTGIGGLGGIPAKRGKILRPLIGWTRAEVEAYCEENDLRYCSDSTNATDEYARNRVRRQILPLMHTVHPGAEDNLRREMALFREEDAYLASLADAAYENARTSCGLDEKKLKEENPVLQRRILGRFLEENGVPKSTAHIAACEAMLASGKGKWTAAADKTVVLRRGELLIEPTPVPAWEMGVSEGTFTLPGGAFFAEICERSVWESARKFHKNLLYLSLDYDTIKGEIVARRRQNGDATDIAGRRGNKRVKQWLIDAKYTSYEKSVTPVFTDKEGIIALGGFGPAMRCRITAQTTRVWAVWKQTGNQGVCPDIKENFHER